jgi:hypothetical protein
MVNLCGEKEKVDSIDLRRGRQMENFALARFGGFRYKLAHKQHISYPPHRDLIVI